MKVTKKNSGFTLIELLVVIAIIGLLAAMVLVAVSSARNKAKDARIRSDLAQLRTLQEAAASGSGSYVALDNTVAPGFTALNADITTQGGALTQANNSTNWCVASSLNSTSGNAQGWCVDTTGISKGCNTSTGANMCASGACNTTTCAF